MSSASDMEDVKPSIASFADDGGAMEARFSDLCKTKLSLDEGTLRQSVVLFRESKHVLLANMSAIGSGSPEEIERFWSAFVVYTVTKLSKGRFRQENEENGVTLCQILRIFKLNAADFFKEMPQFCLKAGYIISGLYGSDWEKRLEVKELQANIVHLCLLSRYYRRAYQELFLQKEAKNDEDSAVSAAVGCISDYHRFGWLLFLALRVHAFGRFKDLVTCTNGLVSILAILVLHVPMHVRKFVIQDSPIFAKKSEKGVNLLASLCEQYDASEDELRRVMEMANNLIVDILKKKPCTASDCKKENLAYIDTDGLTHFDALLEEKSLQSSIVTLEIDYDDAILKGELDERMFVNDEESLLGSGSLSGGAVNMCGMKRKYDAIVSPAKSITSPLSPPCSPGLSFNGRLTGSSRIAPATPVSTAMTTAKWLRSIITPLPSRPSTELLRFLSSCDKDLTVDITERARIILGAIFPCSYFGEQCISGSDVRSAARMDSMWAEQRNLEALKLYYRVLETMCRAESHVLNGNNLTSLLSNERFHRCMLACSAELVLTAHKTVTLMFPAVLEKTGITAFDLSKVIESFVRHEETLPRELKRHLNSLEERLLESMAWEKGSSMYNSLIVAKPALSAEIDRLGLLAEPMPSLDAIAGNYNVSSGGLPLPFQKREHSPDQSDDIRSPKKSYNEYRIVLMERNFLSPVKDRAFYSPKSKLPPLQSAFASPTRPNPSGGGETCAETGINIFLSKIAKLAAIRIKSLSERLQLSQQIMERVYSLVQLILAQQTSLFFNRHIDQLILCSFYGVAKISQLSLTFKEIIYNYRKQPQCKPQVFRSVFVHWPATCRNGKTGPEHVDIITFYNEVFIPSVKPLLVELGQAGGSSRNNKIPEEKISSDSQIPGSPRLSSFPNLPDMSPKKVSAVHNVYVSPLRSTKMDALRSPSSKSYYACVGESTHAYRSPSKDLSAINNRLNSGRKVSAKLNFDVVSDFVVAGSLQNAANSGPAAPIMKLAVKAEKPDA